MTTSPADLGVSEAAEASLAQHLARRYGIRIAATQRLEPWSPCVHRIDLEDGRRWVARLFPPARPLERVRGDVEILRMLASHDYPAERIAHPEPLSMNDRHGIIVTQFVEGGMFSDIALEPDAWTAKGTGAAQRILLRKLGSLLGRLQTLPASDGAAARDAGSWHGHAPREGLPKEDLRCARALLRDIERRVPDEFRARHQSLVQQVDSADDCGDLPRAFIHADFGGPNVLVTPTGEQVVIDWSGAGRGPRVTSLAWLVHRFRDRRCVDAVVSGYREWIELDESELTRLPAAMRIMRLYHACRSFYGAMLDERAPRGFGALLCTEADNTRCDAIAARVASIYRDEKWSDSGTDDAR